ncbi:MAG: ferrous iron transport protein B [Bacteroidota bacterium]
MDQSPLHIVLVGNPNTGKSTLFNTLTGQTQKISNLPGTTIEEKTGHFFHKDVKVHVTDLPGTYSLYPNGEDEQITAKFILEHIDNKINTIVFVADAGNLERNLLLYTQISDLGLPVILALNMMDMLESKNLEVDIPQLSLELQTLVVPVNARKGEGLQQLKDTIFKSNQALQNTFFNPVELQNDLIKNAEGSSTPYSKWQRIYSNYKQLKNKLTGPSNEDLYLQTDKLIADETEKRFTKISEIIAKTVKKKVEKRKNPTQRIDSVLLHPVYGFLIFFTTLFIIFQSIFRLAEYPKGWIETCFSVATTFLKSNLPDNVFSQMLCDGILPGLSGVIVFLPQIIILFLILALLEDSGYMTRVSFITDRLMRKFGLNGKSVIPLIGGMACAIPSIMATRNIENKKDRLITILVTPLMSCSARLPVYTLLAGLLFVPENTYGIDMRGLLILGMYLLGFVMALLFAFIFKLILRQKQKSFFVLELPDYRLPKWQNIWMTLKLKTKDFVFNAGKIILIVSVILWFLASHGPEKKFAAIDARYAQYTAPDKDAKVKADQLEASYAGSLGKLIEPTIKPLGYDWKIGIALITSFAAREVFVGTVSTIYSVGSVDDEQLIGATLSKQVNQNTGLKTYTLPVVLSLLVFYAFAMQCISTLAVTYRETKSMKWPIVQFVYMSGFAYLMSLIVYQTLS